MPSYFCPQCGTQLTLSNVSWRVSFPQEVIDATTEPFLSELLNEQFGSAEVRSTGQALLTPEQWNKLRTEIGRQEATEMIYLATDSTTGFLRTFLRGHERVRLDITACCPHCGQPRGDSPGRDLPAGFFDFEKVIGVAIAGATSWGKTCLLLSLLMHNCQALNQESALNPFLAGVQKPRFEFTAPRLSDYVQYLLQKLGYPPYQCPQGTRALEEPIPIEMYDYADGKRYLILIYDTAGEFYQGNQGAQLRFLEYATGLIYLIDPGQTGLQPVRTHASGHLRPLSAMEQAALQADSERMAGPGVWRKSTPQAPAEPIGKLLRDLCGLSGTQNLLPRAKQQHIAYTLVKADRLYHNEHSPFWQVCGASALLPDCVSASAGAYYMRSEVNEQLFQAGNCALHRIFQMYLPQYSLHTVSALGSEPVEDTHSHIYHLRCAPAPNLVEEPFLAVIRHGLK